MQIIYTTSTYQSKISGKELLYYWLEFPGIRTYTQKYVFIASFSIG